MNTTQRSYLLQALSWVFISLLVYTASSKLFSPVAFRVVLSQSPLLGATVNFWAVAIPLAELAVALLLVWERTRRAGLYGALVLMVLFSVYIGYMLLAAPHLPCSCGGVISALGWPQHLVLNVVLAGLAAWGCRLDRRLSVDHGHASDAPPDPQNIIAQ